MAGWYQRWENNGWRPVSERLFVDPESAAINAAGQHQHWAHFSPTIRRQQKELAAKQRKRAWMAEIYRSVYRHHSSCKASCSAQHQLNRYMSDADDVVGLTSVMLWHMDSRFKCTVHSQTPQNKQTKCCKDIPTMKERGRIFRQAMVNQPAASAEQVGLEQEVDTDLLRWSSLLDFEDYSR